MFFIIYIGTTLHSIHQSFTSTWNNKKGSLKDIRPSFCPHDRDTHHTRTRGPENPSNPLCSEFFSSLLERAAPSSSVCLRSGGKGCSLGRNFGFFGPSQSFPDHRYNLREKTLFLLCCRYLLVRIWRGKVNCWWLLRPHDDDNDAQELQLVSWLAITRPFAYI